MFWCAVAVVRVWRQRVASARNGAKTLLVERVGFAGGIITAVGLPYFDGIAHVKDNRVVVGGIALELLVKMGVCKADVEKLPQHNVTIPNVERFKLLADRLLKAEAPRLSVLFHTLVLRRANQGRQDHRSDGRQQGRPGSYPSQSSH